MEDRIVEIKLLADYYDGKPVYEAVPAIKIAGNRYRLVASPGLAPGAASGDEVEAACAGGSGYRVVKRSGNLSIQLFLKECSLADRTKIVHEIEFIGGWLDGGGEAKSGHLLVFTIHVSRGFDTIERAMAKIVAEFPVDKWMYGNVYDTRDGITPLNWWL
jgi:hypothetical protein